MAITLRNINHEADLCAYPNDFTLWANAGNLATVTADADGVADRLAVSNPGNTASIRLFGYHAITQRTQFTLKVKAGGSGTYDGTVTLAIFNQTAVVEETVSGEIVSGTGSISGASSGVSRVTFTDIPTDSYTTIRITMDNTPSGQEAGYYIIPTGHPNHLKTGSILVKDADIRYVADASASPGETTAIVSWYSDDAGTTVVDYGPTVSYGSQYSDGTSTNIHRAALSGLTAGTTYYYRVRTVGASDTGEETGGSPHNQFTTTGGDVTGPVISNIVAGTGSPRTTGDPNGATVTWTTDETSTSQVLYGKTTSTVNQTSVDTNLVTSHSTSLSGLDSGTLYYYKVKSVDGVGNSTTSDLNTFTTATGDITGPTLSNIVVTPGVSSASVTATADESADIKIEYGAASGSPLTSGSPETFEGTVSYSGSYSTSLSATIPNLSPETGYVYRITTKDATGNETVEDVGVFVTDALTPPVISNVSVSVDGGSVTISWNTDKGATTRAYYGLSPSYGFSTAYDGTLTTSHIVTITGLSGATTYFYKLESKDSDLATGTYGDSGSPLLGQFTTGDVDTTPPVISNLTVDSVSSSSGTISWTTDENADTQIEWGTSSGSYPNTTSLNQTLSTSHTQTILNLQNNTTYYFRVISTDESGNTARSSESSFLTADIHKRTGDSFFEHIIGRTQWSFTNSPAVAVTFFTVAPTSTSAGTEISDSNFSRISVGEGSWNVNNDVLTNNADIDISALNNTHSIVATGLVYANAATPLRREDIHTWIVESQTFTAGNSYKIEPGKLVFEFDKEH